MSSCYTHRLNETVCTFDKIDNRKEVKFMYLPAYSLSSMFDISAVASDRAVSKSDTAVVFDTDRSEVSSVIS